MYNNVSIIINKITLNDHLQYHDCVAYSNDHDWCDYQHDYIAYSNDHPQHDSVTYSNDHYQYDHPPLHTLMITILLL